MGIADSPVYATWEAMIQRCTNPRSLNYKRYGARGIRVCKRWRKFENFFADMGDRPIGRSIERKNNSRNYCSSNCRWATRTEQMNNMRANVRICYHGETFTLAQWSRKLKRSYTAIRKRIKRGWPVRAALFSPPNIHHRKWQLQTGEWQ